jgi:hypothetical protein
VKPFCKLADWPRSFLGETTFFGTDFRVATFIAKYEAAFPSPGCLVTAPLRRGFSLELPPHLFACRHMGAVFVLMLVFMAARKPGPSGPQSSREPSTSRDTCTQAGRVPRPDHSAPLSRYFGTRFLIGTTPQSAMLDFDGDGDRP